jgi:cobalt-zinc-cadmium efflux system membrane fusion protein
MKRIEPILTISTAITFLVLAATGCGGGAPTETTYEESVDDSGHEDDHGESRIVRIDSEDLDRLGLQLSEAGPGDLEITVELPGEVQVNGDRMAHVGPRVGGVAREVTTSLGDTVRTGQILAILESRELADSKAAFLAASERNRLAEATYRREERLWQEKVSSEQDFLDAQNGLAEAIIGLRAAEQKLHALGLDEDEVRQLEKEPDTRYTHYRIRAPFDGNVVDRHITVGESIPAETPVFTVADLSTVWIDLSVYQKDLARIEPGQRVHVSPANNGVEGTAVIEFVQPLLGEDTRTALARITMDNPERRWKPGMFVTAAVVIAAPQVEIRVPATALIRMDDGADVVFVQTDEGYEPRPVTHGRRSHDYVEVTSGLLPGERYVTAGGFILKAELGKEAFGDDDD